MGVRSGPAVPQGRSSHGPRQQQDDPHGGALVEATAGLEPKQYSGVNLEHTDVPGMAYGDLGRLAGYKNVVPGGSHSGGWDSASLDPLCPGMGCGNGASGCGGADEGGPRPTLEGAGGGQ